MKNSKCLHNISWTFASFFYFTGCLYAFLKTLGYLRFQKILSQMAKLDKIDIVSKIEIENKF